MKKLLLVVLMCVATGAYAADIVITNNLGQGWTAKVKIKTVNEPIVVAYGKSIIIKSALPMDYTVSGIKIKGLEKSLGTTSGSITAAGNYVINLGPRGTMKTIKNPDQSKDDTYETSYTISVDAQYATEGFH